MPGVLLIECMAQTTGWLVSALTGFTGLPVLAGVKEGKIRAAVFPGDELRIRRQGDARRLRLRHRRGQGIAARATPICDATLTYRIIPYPSPELRAGTCGIGPSASISRSRSS